MKVMTVNLLFGTADPAALVALIKAEHPDVLVLVELTPAAIAALDRAGLRGELPYQVLRPFDRAAGTGIYARVPLRPTGRATLDHASFRHLLKATGLRDAHDARGGLVRTWPQGRRVPAFAHLDHMLVSPELAVGIVRDRAVIGSDHRAVVPSWPYADFDARCPAVVVEPPKMRLPVR